MYINVTWRLKSTLKLIILKDEVSTVFASIRDMILLVITFQRSGFTHWEKHDKECKMQTKLYPEKKLWKTSEVNVRESEPISMTQDKLFQTVLPLLESNYRNINVNLWRIRKFSAHLMKYFSNDVIEIIYVIAEQKLD